MTERRTADEDRRARAREFRRIIGAAVGELRAAQNRASYASLSLEELIDEQILRLDDPNASPTSPSRLQRLTKVKDDLLTNIEAIRETPPEVFRSPSSSNDVNTEPDPED